jgi:hypothetical protein
MWLISCINSDFRNWGSSLSFVFTDNPPVGAPLCLPATWMWRSMSSNEQAVQGTKNETLDGTAEHGTRDGEVSTNTREDQVTCRWSQG